MVYFHVWLQNKEDVSLLEPRESNLSNVEAYSEACQYYYYINDLFRFG